MMKSKFSFFGVFRRLFGLDRKASTAIEIDLDEISAVENVTQKTTAKLDPTNPIGFRGLPSQVQKVLEAQGFGKEEVESHYEDVMEVVSMHFDGGIHNLYKPTQHLVGRLSMAEIMDKAAEIQTSNPRTKYNYNQKKDMIGKGGYGQVFKCTDRSTKQQYAMKVAEIKKKKQIETEIKMHALSNNHPNVVGFVEAFVYEKKLYMVVELMTAGSLTDYILDLPRHIHWKEAAIVYVLREVLKGLAFMHSNHHLHRDIKSDNVLLSNEGSVKIADFGFAVGLTKEEAERQTVLGTPYWMAPEIISKKRYDQRVDVWALGITAIEIAEGVPPHMGTKPLKAMFLIKTGDPPRFKEETRWSDDLNHFLKLCLMKDPKERPTSADLLMHPALAQEKMCQQKDFAKMMKSIKKLVEERKEQRRKAKEAAANAKK